jgi:hypothetical protein
MPPASHEVLPLVAIFDDLIDSSRRNYNSIKTTEQYWTGKEKAKSLSVLKITG